MEGNCCSCVSSVKGEVLDQTEFSVPKEKKKENASTQYVFHTNFKKRKGLVCITLQRSVTTQSTSLLIFSNLYTHIKPFERIQILTSLNDPIPKACKSKLNAFYLRESESGSSSASSWQHLKWRAQPAARAQLQLVHKIYRYRLKI